MPHYRIKPGFQHGVASVYKAGDIVELTEAEAIGFLDKMDLVPSPEPNPEPNPEPVPNPTPKPEPEMEPFDGYDAMTAAEVVELLATMSAEAADYVKVYEASHKNRKTILEA